MSSDGFLNGCLSSVSSCVSHMSSLAASFAEINSDSVLDWAKDVCLREQYVTGHPQGKSPHPKLSSVRPMGSPNLHHKNSTCFRCLVNLMPWLSVCLM